jgi:hypothetical protein
MIFDYRGHLIALPDSDDYGLLSRPEISLVIRGPLGERLLTGLVDTGSDYTVLPASVAAAFGISLREEPGISAKSFGGLELHLLVGDVQLTIEQGGESVSWPESVCFFDFGKNRQTAVLGHAGFLDYFTATFDGLNSMLTLIPNELLPSSLG